MGILSSFFKKPEPFNHPELGIFNPTSGNHWISESGFSSNSIKFDQVILPGTKKQPFEESLEGLTKLKAEIVSKISIPEVEKELTELRENYFDDEPDNLDSLASSSIWEQTQSVALFVVDDQDFQLSIAFTWQHQDDGHQITLVFHKGEFEGATIDG